MVKKICLKQGTAMDICYCLKNLDIENRKAWLEKIKGASIIVSKDSRSFILYFSNGNSVVVMEDEVDPEVKENILQYMDNLLRSKYIVSILCNNDQLIDDLNTRMNKFAGIQKTEALHEEAGVMFHKYVFNKGIEG